MGAQIAITLTVDPFILCFSEWPKSMNNITIPTNLGAFHVQWVEHINA